MQKEAEDPINRELHLIEHWLRDTCEAFDDWSWDGMELTIFLGGKPIEKYTRQTLAEAIPGFPPA